MKRSADWIPFCHPLSVEGCEFSVEPERHHRRMVIACRVVTTARVGIEMEALVRASAAALTVYDMAKALGVDDDGYRAG